MRPSRMLTALAVLAAWLLPAGLGLASQVDCRQAENWAWYAIGEKRSAGLTALWRGCNRHDAGFFCVSADFVV